MYLWGGPTPQGWEVIPVDAVRVRKESTPARICEIAGFGSSIYHRLMKDTSKQKALQACLEKCEKGGPNPKPPLDDPAFAATNAESQREMWAYARHARATAVRKRVGITKSTFHSILTRAEKAGYGAGAEVADDIAQHGRRKTDPRAINGDRRQVLMR